MVKIINLVGIDDENKIVVEHNRGIVSQLSFRIEGNSGFLHNLNKNEFDISMLIIGGEKFTLQLTFPKNALLFNSIGLAEGHSKSLHQLSTLLSQVSNPVINHPKNVLLTARDSIGEVLSGVEGVMVPKCLKMTPGSIQDVTEFIEKNNLGFPFLFRPLVAHGLESLIRINSLNDMEKLHRFAFDGKNEFYVTQFLDFRSKDGLYRKMRFMIIGEEVIPRHLILSTSWQIHTESKTMDSRLKTQQLQEEIGFLGNIELLVGKRLMEIKNAFGLDCVGIDCSVNSKGEIVIFEINPFSMFGIGKEDVYHQATITHSYHALDRLIKQKIITVNSRVKNNE